jgi:egghead protein (zeste-white 4 protein)
MTSVPIGRVSSAHYYLPDKGDGTRPIQLGRPHFRAFVLSFLAFSIIGTWAWLGRVKAEVMDFYLAFFWTLPVLTSAIGMYGAVVTARRMRGDRLPAQQPAPTSQQLLVVIPTVGRVDTVPALERVIRSTRRSLPAFFERFRIDVVIEERCAARARIEAIAKEDSHTNVIVVPSSFQTINRTLFKARANHYANLVRLADGEVRDDVWVLHMDDDTDLRSDTAAELARFLSAQQDAGDSALDLCQGVLCYPRELAENHLVWLADAVRPGCDISLFSATTGRGSPRAGLHGEMLMVRASIEAAIGWDFGPRTIVEDAQFALHFCARYPGRSGWIPARSYGASPATLRDFIRQRERWVWGLLELTIGRSQRYSPRQNGETHPVNPSRWHSLLMLNNTLVWACAPLGHPAVVLVLCLIAGDLQTAPMVLVLAPLWAFNAAYGLWLYWEGLKLNASSSRRSLRAWWEPVCLVALVPLFTLWEVAGIIRGICRFVRGGRPKFTVIAKPA